MSPPAFGLTEANVHIRRDTDETEDAWVEAEILFHDVGAVREQRVLDCDARYASTTRKSQSLQELRRRRALAVCRIRKVLDEDILGHEARQISCTAGVHERVDREHRHPFLETLRRPRRHRHLSDIAGSRV